LKYIHTVKNRNVRSVSVINFKDCDAAKNGRLEIHVFIFEGIGLFYRGSDASLYLGIKCWEESFDPTNSK